MAPRTEEQRRESIKQLERVRASMRDLNEIVEEEDEVENIGCGILARYPVLSIVIFAAVGIGIGVGLSYWMPENPQDKVVALQWIGLLGVLFVRALKCIVLLLVFVNVVVSVMEMYTIGKAGAIGWKTVAFYMSTTILAAIFGVVATLMMMGLYTQGIFAEPEAPTVTLGCINAGYLMAEGPDGNIACSNMYAEDAPEVNFYINDVSGYFMHSTTGVSDDVSLSDTIYGGVFIKLITDNIVFSFADANFGSVVFFALFFGVGLAHVIDKMQKKSAHKSVVMGLLKELDAVFLTLIRWILALTPFAVLSLITAAIGAQNDLREAFANVGYLVAATAIAFILQIVIVYMGMFALVTRSNPITYLSHIVPSPTFAFASQSSAATIPVTLKAVKSTGRVSPAVASFVIPLGATVNMDGAAIYFPIACVWLAVLNGIVPNAGQFILLVVVSTIGSIGSAPVPYASLALIITVYNSVFNTVGTPAGFEYVIAIDWFMDRLQAALNVTGDAVVAAMVSYTTPMEELEALSAQFHMKEEALPEEDEKEAEDTEDPANERSSE